MSQDEKHKATELPVEQRTEYLLVVASMAAADKKVDPAELAKLRDLCKAFELPPAEMGEVLAAADGPSAERVRAALKRLRDSELKFTLITDCLFMAYADGSIGKEEEAEVRGIADSLGVAEAQVAALRKYVEAVRKIGQEKLPQDKAKELLGEALATAASVGAPVGAIAVSGSVFGLSAAGITSGLAALGMGLGMATGVGVAVGIGIGSFMGVRWLYKKAVG